MGPPWDTDYCWRVQLAGFKLTLVESAKVHYRVRTTARARFLQAFHWGDKQLNLQLRYGMTPWPRYLAYCLLNVTRRGTEMMVGPIFTSRPFAYWTWRWGFARGQLRAFPRLFAAQMRGEGKMREARWKREREQNDQSVRSA
jgi:GT2 family glycosyltransferase